MPREIWLVLGNMLSASLLLTNPICRARIRSATAESVAPANYGGAKGLGVKMPIISDPSGGDAPTSGCHLLAADPRKARAVWLVFACMPLAGGDGFAGYAIVRQLGGVKAVYLVQRPRLVRCCMLEPENPRAKTTSIRGVVG